MDIGERTDYTGKEDFVEKFIDYVRKHEEIKEIPRSQRYVNRPALAQLFKADTMKNKLKRNKMIREAVIRYGYNQNEISDHLGMHYSTISRLLKDEGKCQK